MSNAPLNEVSRQTKVEKFTDLKSLQVWLARDFRNFVQYANRRMGFKTGRIQLFIADALQAGEPTLLLMCFRNSSKTYLVDLYCLWRLHRYINTKILILSNKDKTAKKHIRQFCKMITYMPALHYMKFSKITETSLQLSGATVEADLTVNSAGIFTSVEGSRADLIVIDDAEVARNSNTPTMREKLLNRFSEVEAILQPPGRHVRQGKEIPTPEKTQSIYIGTPQSEFSVYLPEDSPKSPDAEDAEPHPLLGAKIIKIPAIIEGRSSFPEKWSRQQLEIKRRKMSKPAWALQYMLDPSSYDKEARVINWDNVLKVEAEIMDPVMAIDPAGEKGGGDEHAYCIGGLVKGDQNRTHVRVLTGTRGYTIDEFLDKAIREAKHYGVEKILIESNFSGYLTLLQKKIAEAGNFCTVEGIKSTVRKQDRLVETLDPAINGHRVSFEPNVFVGEKENVRQFKEWTYKSLPTNDDRLDALSFLVAYYQAAMAYPDQVKWEAPATLGDPWQ